MMARKWVDRDEASMKREGCLISRITGARDADMVKNVGLDEKVRWTCSNTMFTVMGTGRMGLVGISKTQMFCSRLS